MARRITNEADMNDVLANNGFEVIQPETFTMAEQVKLCGVLVILWVWKERV